MSRILDTMSVITARGLSKCFGQKQALDGVYLEVQPGDLFGLFGPNGAGKTTLLRILTGQLEQDNGEATVLGIDVKRDPMEVKRQVGIVPEVESPPTYLTAYEYLYFVSQVRRIAEPEARIDKWLDFFDMREARDIICRDLSKGMRQKMMLASAFIHEPKLLFLDEPFINLDPIYQRKLREHLLDYVAKGGTVFMCSHILEIAERLCSRAAIINDGRIIKTSDMSEMVKDGARLEETFLKLVGKGG